MNDRPQEIAQGFRLGRRAAEFGKNDAVALTRSGHALAISAAISTCSTGRCCSIRTSHRVVSQGLPALWKGECDNAIERFTHAMRFSPLDRSSIGYRPDSRPRTSSPSASTPRHRGPRCLSRPADSLDGGGNQCCEPCAFGAARTKAGDRWIICGASTQALRCSNLTD